MGKGKGGCRKRGPGLERERAQAPARPGLRSEHGARLLAPSAPQEAPRGAVGGAGRADLALGGAVPTDVLGAVLGRRGELRGVWGYRWNNCRLDWCQQPGMRGAGPGRCHRPACATERSRLPWHARNCCGTCQEDGRCPLAPVTPAPFLTPPNSPPLAQEPIGFFVTGTTSILSYLWYMQHQREFTWSEMHQRMISGWEVGHRVMGAGSGTGGEGTSWQLHAGGRLGRDGRRPGGRVPRPGAPRTFPTRRPHPPCDGPTTRRRGRLPRQTLTPSGTRCSGTQWSGRSRRSSCARWMAWRSRASPQPRRHDLTPRAPGPGFLTPLRCLPRPPGAVAHDPPEPRPHSPPRRQAWRRVQRDPAPRMLPSPSPPRPVRPRPGQTTDLGRGGF